MEESSIKNKTVNHSRDLGVGYGEMVKKRAVNNWKERKYNSKPKKSKTRESYQKQT